MSETAQRTEAEERGLTTETLQKIRTEFMRQKGLAAEYQGGAGQYLRNQIEHHGLNKDAFQFVIKALKKDSANRADFVRSVFLYVLLEKDELLAQFDAFDDVGSVLERMLAVVRGQQPDPERRNAKNPDEQVPPAGNGAETLASLRKLN